MDQWNNSSQTKKALIVAGTSALAVGAMLVTSGTAPLLAAKGYVISAGNYIAASAQGAYTWVSSGQALAYFQSLGPAGYAAISSLGAMSGVAIAYGKDILNWIKEKVKKVTG